MPLLRDVDYAHLKECGLQHAEDETQRHFVVCDYPLPEGLYCHNGTPRERVSVLLRIPTNYNISGCNMFWVHPSLKRVDGKAIPAASTDPTDKHSLVFQGNTYCRWSRHYKKEQWKPGTDGLEKLLSQIEWALRNPDADKRPT